MRVFQVDAVYGKWVSRYIVLALSVQGAHAESEHLTIDADHVWIGEIAAGPTGSLSVLLTPDCKMREHCPAGYVPQEGFEKVE